jgi:alpha-tubulin suppressor-like RCC1 family protein
MTRRAILHSAPLLLAAATLLAACSENLTTDAGARTPLTPRLTVTPTNAFVTIDGGQTHACGLTSGGQTWCWGRNNAAQIGDSTFTNRKVAVQVKQGGVSYVNITGGQMHTCAISTAGQAYCWGYNADGRLGDSTTSLRRVPVAVHPVGTISFASISAGTQHTCGLDGSGQGYCWGSNASGQIGNNSTTYAKIATAVQQGGSSYVQIAAGYVHTCALDGGGQAYCWGYGGDGQLGYGFTTGDSLPAAVTQGGVPYSSIYTEYDHTCALDASGLAYCWGRNNAGQLGDGTTTTQYTPVAVVMPVASFTTLALGSASTCGLDGSTGQAYCWGAGGNGQLGDGNNTDSLSPVAVSQSAPYVSVRAEGSGFCALDTVGQTWCWGRNNYGQLGNNTLTDSGTPVAVVH